MPVPVFVFRLLRLVLGCLLSSLLTACATTGVPAGGPYPAHEQSSPAFQLEEAETWSMTGKLGLRSPQKNASLGVWWNQEGEEFQIDFRGALALGGGRISGQPGVGIKLEKNGEEPVYGDSLEHLVEQLTGLRIPVSPMKYWVRGIPSPEANYSRGQHSIDQKGWLVEYKMDSRGLPKRITLTRGEVLVRVVVKSWDYEALKSP